MISIAATKTSRKRMPRSVRGAVVPAGDGRALRGGAGGCERAPPASTRRRVRGGRVAGTPLRGRRAGWTGLAWRTIRTPPEGFFTRLLCKLPHRSKPARQPLWWRLGSADWAGVRRPRAPVDGAFVGRRGRHAGRRAAAVGQASMASSAMPPRSSIRQPAVSGSRGTKPVSSVSGASSSSRPSVMPRCSVHTTSWFSRTASR